MRTAIKLIAKEFTLFGVACTATGKPRRTWAADAVLGGRLYVVVPRHEVARAVTARVLQRYGEAALVGRAREAANEWEAMLMSGTVKLGQFKLGKRDGCAASRDARI